MSGYVILSLFAKENGYSEIIDIGSGDGRIAYCWWRYLVWNRIVLNLDNMLVDLQKSLRQQMLILILIVLMQFNLIILH